MTALTCPTDVELGTTTAKDTRVLVATAGMTLLFAAVWLVSLSRSLCDPMGPDQAYFQYIVQGLFVGQIPYVDVYNEDGPAILLVHALSTLIFGRTDLAIRMFDACWMAMTLAALIGLAMRDRRSAATGLLAAVLYACIYYGQGYIYTCQRDGFAVLPALLALHCMIADRPSPAWKAAGRGLAAGVLGAFAFGFKPTLGLCFGLLWLQACADLWRHRGHGLKAAANLAGLTGGFLVSALAVAGLLYRWGAWDSYWQILRRTHPLVAPGYVTGPQLLYEMRYRIIAAVPILAIVIGLALLLTRSRPRQRDAAGPRWTECLALLATATCVFSLLVTIYFWPDWRGMLFVGLGAVVPAMGFLILRPWRLMSRVQRLVVLTALAGLGSILIQGKFHLYHFFPLAACASYLAANEVANGLEWFCADRRANRFWMAVCIAAVLFTIYAPWWRQMTRYSTAIYPLADASRVEHYARVTRKMNAPAYETKLKVARRIQELTTANEPITLMFFDLWLYHMVDRPPAQPMVYVNAHTMADQPAMIDYVLQRKPRILAARLRSRIPAESHAGPQVVFASLVDDLEECFGAAARQIGSSYRLVEMIDDVGLLERVPS